MSDCCTAIRAEIESTGKSTVVDDVNTGISKRGNARVKFAIHRAVAVWATSARW